MTEKRPQAWMRWPRRVASVAATGLFFLLFPDQQSGELNLDSFQLVTAA